VFDARLAVQLCEFCPPGSKSPSSRGRPVQEALAHLRHSVSGKRTPLKPTLHLSQVWRELFFCPRQGHFLRPAAFLFKFCLQRRLFASGPPLSNIRQLAKSRANNLRSPFRRFDCGNSTLATPSWAEVSPSDPDGQLEALPVYERHPAAPGRRFEAWMRPGYHH
jgi:hypothetical protein